MRSEHHIYIHKNGKEGVTPLTAESPPAAQSGASSPKLSDRGKLLLGYSALLAKRSYASLTEEIRASGNESAATVLGNLTTAATMGTAILATKGLALIPMAIGEAVSTVTNYRATQRENYTKTIKRELKGQRVDFNQGRVYFD